MARVHNKQQDERRNSRKEVLINQRCRKQDELFEKINLKCMEKHLSLIDMSNLVVDLFNAIQVLLSVYSVEVVKETTIVLADFIEQIR